MAQSVEDKNNLKLGVVTCHTYGKLEEEAVVEELKKLGHHFNDDLLSDKEKEEEEIENEAEAVGVYSYADELDIKAVQWITRLLARSIDFSRIPIYDQMIIFRYFYRNNPIVYRTINLLVSLPLSHLSFRFGDEIGGLAKDYAQHFYDDINNRIDLIDLCRTILLHKYLYGQTFIRIEDVKKTKDLDSFDIADITESQQKLVSNLDAKYAQENITAAEISTYFTMTYPHLDKKYKGPLAAVPLDFRNLKDLYLNEDTDYVGINQYLSKSMQNLLSDNKTDDDIKKALKHNGYTEAWNDLVKTIDGDAIFLDTDDQDSASFLVADVDLDEGSRLLKALPLLLEYELTSRAIFVMIDLLGKVGRLITADGISEEQLTALRDQVQEMLNNPTTTGAVITNFQCTWQEVEKSLNDQIHQIQDKRGDNKKDIVNALGFSANLFDDESTYTGNVIAYDIINTMFQSERAYLAKYLDRKLFNAISIRKGLITKNKWGENQVITPDVTFSRFTIRDESQRMMIENMVNNQQAPLSLLYEYLNIDVNSVQDEMTKSLFTFKDSNFKNVLAQLYSNFEWPQAVYTMLTDKINNSFGLTTEQQADVDKEQEVKEDEGLDAAMGDEFDTGDDIGMDDFESMPSSSGDDFGGDMPMPESGATVPDLSDVDLVEGEDVTPTSPQQTMENDVNLPEV